MQTLSIVYTMPFAYPATRFGGPVAQLALTCGELARRGHRVSWVATDLGVGNDVPRNRWFEHEGYRVWVGGTRPPHRVAPYWAPMLRAPLREAIADASVLHLQLGLTLLNPLAATLACDAGVPYVYAPRGALCPERLRLRRWSKRLFLIAFERRVMRNAAALHALTEKERRDLLAQGVDDTRIVRVPNGVATPSRLPDREVARRRFGLGRRDRVILFLGQLHPVKGLDLLIDSFADVASASADLRLLVAGRDSGVRAAALAAVTRLGLGDRVRFVGHVHGDDKLLAYGAADLFVLASRSEGMPNVVLEAAAMGLPMIISDACQLPEVARANAGEVVAATRAALTAALQRWLARDAATLAAMSRHARQLAEDRFSVTSVVDALERLYARITTEAATSRRSVTLPT